MLVSKFVFDAIMLGARLRLFFSDFLKIAFETYWFRGLPLRESLALCSKINRSLPKVAEIWEYSQFSNRWSEHVDELKRFESEALDGLLEGRYTMETPAVSSI